MSDGNIIEPKVGRSDARRVSYSFLRRLSSPISSELNANRHHVVAVSVDPGKRRVRLVL